MAEFLSQYEIDALLDIAEQDEDIETDRYNKINEIITFSESLAECIRSKNRVQSIVECSNIIKYIDSLLKDYNLNISDMLSYNYKSKEDELYIKIPRSSEESKERLGYTLKELQNPETFQESLDTLNRLEVNIMTDEVKLKGI